jgi:hypothetical protein
LSIKKKSQIKTLTKAKKEKRKKERKIEHQIWKKKKNEGVKLKNKKLSQIKRSKSKERGYNLIYK